MKPQNFFLVLRRKDCYELMIAGTDCEDLHNSHQNLVDTYGPLNVLFLTDSEFDQLYRTCNVITD